MSRPDLLYLMHRFPYPPDKGDRIRSFHLLEFLASHARVHLACLADEPVTPEALEALRPLCHRVSVAQLGRRSRWVGALGSFARGGTVSEGAFHSHQLRRTLRQWARETNFHIAIASASSIAPYLQMAELKHIPAVVDLVDVDSEKWSDYAAATHGPRSWLYRTEARRLRRMELDLSRWAHAVTLVSDRETALHQRSCSFGNISTVQNGVDLNYFQPDAMATETPASCVFVGALDYLPNVDAARWFCREVWPRVLALGYTATLFIVGRNPSREVLQLGDLPGVEIVGSVADVRPFLAHAQVVVVPLRIARGMQNKVLEALAMGKPVVCSPQALAGIAAEPGTHVLSASDPTDWVQSISRLFDDEALRQGLARAGRRYVEENHQWDRCLKPFAATLGLTS